MESTWGEEVLNRGKSMEITKHPIGGEGMNGLDLL